jgi:Ternary complex associated domain 7
MAARAYYSYGIVTGRQRATKPRPIRTFVMVLLDAEMSVPAAVRRLAQHGFWKDPGTPSVRSWLKEYVASINELASSADNAGGNGPDQAGVANAATSAGPGRATVLTVDNAVRLLARPLNDQWATIRRQHGVTIFWYARAIAELLDAFAQATPAGQTVQDILDLHEFTSTPVVQVDDLALRGGERNVVLRGHDLVGVRAPGHDEFLDWQRFELEWFTRGGAPTGREESAVARAPAAATPSTTVQGFPFLDAPQKVKVGVLFELEIGLSGTPVTGVVAAAPLLLPVPAGIVTISIEVEVVADGFDAPQGWRQTLEVAVAEPTKARVKVALVPRPQDDSVRLTTLSVHFVVGGVVRGTASRNIVVETVAGAAPPADPRGVPWLDAEELPPAMMLDSVPCVPDMEMDISKLDGNATSGTYRCVIRNAHCVPVPDGSLIINLGDDADTFAKTLIDQVRQYSGDALVAILLEGIAAQIAGKLPAEFWTVLQEVAKMVKDRPVTFQLNSADPYVPWELAAVEPAIDPTSPPFLGAQVVMGRWILGDRNIASPPRHARNIRAMAVMAGMYKSEVGLRPLPQAIEEAKTLTQSYAAMPAIPLDCTPASFQSLLDATINFNFDPIGGVECVHFAGHGEVDPSRPGDAAIYLNDGRPITPTFFRSSTLGKTYAPFLFLNACMVGTAGQMLGDFGGFPGNCLAGGF